MSLFSKTEVDQKMLPFIENGDGVGIVKVNGYGKASARMESYKIIFDSYEGKHPIIESVSAITYLSYKKGNFISEPKLEIGISHKKYILSGVDNNDDELETFYRTILEVKNLEKEQKKSSYMGITKPVLDDEDELDEIESMADDVNVDLEKEILSETSEEEIVDASNDKSLDESKDIEETTVEEDSDDDFEVLEELDEDMELSKESAENEIQETGDAVEEKTDVIAEETEEVDEKIDEEVEEEVDEESEEEIDADELDELEEFDITDSEELVIESEEIILQSSDEPIVEELDEDFEEFDEELVDNEIDSDRIITDSDENTQNETNNDLIEVEESKESDITSEVNKEVVVEDLQETEDSMDNKTITTDNVTSEIGKMKQQLYNGINNIQNELNSENQNGLQVQSHMQFDPVDQIRRYYELKEDGIITEEEFELKKKQLLDL